MKNFGFTKTVRPWNEDRVFACDKYGFVIDGASVLDGDKWSDFHSDAEWFAEMWSRYLSVALADESKSMRQILEDEVEVLANEYKNMAGGAKIKRFPGASISLVRERGDVLEVFALGDCPMLFETKRNTIFSFKDTRNNINDSVVKAQLKDIAIQEGISMAQASKAHREIILQGRDKDNAFGGAYVLKDEKRVIEFGVYYEIPKKIIKKAVLMSDGYSEIFDTFDMMSQEQLMVKLQDVSSADRLYERLLKQQQADQECFKYERTKMSDDSSVVCMFFD